MGIGIVVDDDTTRAELATAIGHVNREAKRVPRLVGLYGAGPTRHDYLHMQLNKLLDAWEAAAADGAPR